MLASLADVPLVMIYVDGPHKIGRRRSRMLISEPFRLENPERGLDADYLRRQTGLLEEKMKTMTEEFSAIVP